MAFFKSKGVSIAGMATAVPKKKVNVDDYIQIFGEDSVEKFKQKTGIYAMHRTNSDQTSSDLGYAAGDYLLKELGINRYEIGVLVFVSQSPDYRKPATACVLQYRLGLDCSCASFDVSLGCSGFVYGNHIMRSFLASSNAKYGLLIVAETSSKQASEHDKTIAMMFGDAGSAILYENGTDEDSSTLLETDGSRFKSIIVPSGGFRDMNPEIVTFIDPDGNERSKFDAYMDGMGVFAFSITDVPKAMKEYLSMINAKGSDFDYIFLHQANHMIIKQIARRFKVSMDKVPLSLDRFGNTSGVTIPLTICDKFGNSDEETVHILASGFGIGLSLGVTSFEIKTSNILPIIETDITFDEGKI